MSDTTTTAAPTTEPLRPPSQGPARYLVVVTEVRDIEYHEQNYIPNGKEGDRVVYGHVTTCKRDRQSREIFKSEFTKRPSIAALATLIEGGAS